MQKNKRVQHKEPSKKKHCLAILYHFVPKVKKTDGFEHETSFVDNQTNAIALYIRKVFLRRGYTVQLIKIAPDNLYELKKLRAEFVFNLVDSKVMELRIARILDKLHIPYSGSSFEALRASNNKIKSKRIFQKFNLPTASFSAIHPKDRMSRRFIPSKFPIIIKPAFEHCSVGITTHSVAKNYAQFKSIVLSMRKLLKQTLIAEQYIEGKEFHVTVYETKNGVQILPIAEVAFKKGYKGQWNIYDFDAKWNKRSNAFKHVFFIAPPRGLSNAIYHNIKDDVIKAFYAFGLQGYARFDIRYDTEKQQWYFLEANANPGFDPDPHDAMTASVLANHMTLDDFVMNIVHNAIG